MRARSLDDLTDDGWAVLHELGVRTLIDLRNDDERAAAPAPPGITAVHLPLDGSDDREFWDEWAADWRFGTPVYYAPHVARFPERSLGVLTAIAYARPGGVLFHCMGGRDRTGMVTMLVLSLVGVAPEDIAADYELSAGMCPDADAITAGLTRAARRRAPSCCARWLRSTSTPSCLRICGRRYVRGCSLAAANVNCGWVGSWCASAPAVPGASTSICGVKAPSADDGDFERHIAGKRARDRPPRPTPPPPYPAAVDVVPPSHPRGRLGDHARELAALPGQRRLAGLLRLELAPGIAAA